MSTRPHPPSRPPRQQDWKKQWLPGISAAAVVFVIGLIIIIVVATSDDGNGNDNDDDIALDVDATATEIARDDSVVNDDDDSDDSDNSDDSDDSENSDEVDLTPTPFATDDDDDDATPDATEEADVTPAPDPTPVPDPTRAPIIGDFGELPSGDMPSGSPAEAMNLNITLDMSLQAIPSQASAYRIDRRQWTTDSVSNLARQLGIDGDVSDQGGGSFRVEGSNASLYISPTMTQYVRSGTGDSTPELPGNDQLVQQVRSWLADNGVVGANLGSGQVVDRDDSAGRALVVVKPAEPADIISATPSAAVTIRGDGVVTEAMVNWPNSLQGSTYSLRSAEALWADASAGRHFIDVNVDQLPAGFQGSNASIQVTSAGIAYTIGGSPAGTQYLIPVAVFSGNMTVDGAGQSIPARIYVQAVEAQVAPRG